MSAEKMRRKFLLSFGPNTLGRAEGQAFADGLEALLAQVRREVLLEAAKAMCSKCKAGRERRRLSGCWFHELGECEAHEIHELLAEEGK